MILPDDLYDYADDRPRHHSASRSIDPGIDRITVADDWPACVPVTQTEVDVFERYFESLLDEIFGKCPS